ncbi:bax inhibitor 1-like isoform X2 [Salvia miltiorrhiza]|uniref:bax inhibitor 1-like isoform X2 n=1 Tax=Salvia miltiorrhiza TaxID=226208 RepID=UPI0025AB6CDF|nr:bax inhibitor 1-like isoform X2 [Salvia miltiorrhiza]
MDSFSSFFDSQSSSRNRWSYDSLKNFRQISPVVQTHLKQVYLSLCCALLASAVGVYLHILWNVGGTLTSLGCMGCIFWLLATPFHQEQKKVSLLMAAALLEGASIGPLVQLAIEFDPSIVVSAFIGCSLAFGCFSGAAMLARRREYLYLGGLLSSGLSILLWLHFASSIFGGSMALFKFELYFGLLVFVGYIVVDTQDIIEKAHLGDLDYVNHALTLFTDFVAVFVRVLIIMLKNASEKEGKKKKKRN